MTDSKPVSKYPSMNKKDQNNKNLVTESCNVKKTLKTDDIKDTMIKRWTNIQSIYLHLSFHTS